MTEREKALELYTKFQVYYWHEVDGYLPDDEKTLKTCLNVVEEIIIELSDYADNFDCTETFEKVEYWMKVKKEITMI